LVRGRTSFPQGSSCPVVLTYQPRASIVSSTGLSPSLATRSSSVRLPCWFLTRCHDWHHDRLAVQPPRDIGCQATQSLKFGLFPVRSPLLGESISFPHPTLDVSVRVVPFLTSMNSTWDAIPCRMAGCPIRRSPDQCLLAAPRGLSQLTTSFVGTRRLGIHRMPFFLLLLSPVRTTSAEPGVRSHKVVPYPLLWSSTLPARCHPE
jgi:hypothetical protein